MPGARGCRAPERSGRRMGEGERGSVPFRFDPPLHRRVTPPTLGGEGACGRGRSRAWRAGDFPGPGVRVGACMISGEPARARDRGARMGSAGVGSEALRVHSQPWSVGRDRGGGLRV